MKNLYLSAVERLPTFPYTEMADISNKGMESVRITDVISWNLYETIIVRYEDIDKPPVEYLY
jgi:hypothetical protein